MLRLWMAIAAVVVSSGGAAAQSLNPSADAFVMNARVSVSSACATGGDDCARELVNAMRAVAMLAQNVDERESATIAAERIGVVVALATSAISALPRDASADTVSQVVASAAQQVSDSVERILQRAPPAQRAAAVSEIPVAMERLVTASVERIDARPLAAATIGVELMKAIAEMPMSEELRAVAVNVTAARVTRAMPATAPASVVSSTVAIVADMAIAQTQVVASLGVTRPSIAAAIAFGQQQFAAAAAELSRARPEIAEQIAIVVEATTRLDLAPTLDVPRAITVLEASPT